MNDPFLIDTARVRRSFGRSGSAYDAAAVLQTKVRDELLGRLDLVRLEPVAVLDLGAGTGHASLALKRRYPASRVVALDLPGFGETGRIADREERLCHSLMFGVTHLRVAHYG